MHTRVLSQWGGKTYVDVETQTEGEQSRESRSNEGEESLGSYMMTERQRDKRWDLSIVSAK